MTKWIVMLSLISTCSFSAYALKPLKPALLEVATANAKLLEIDGKIFPKDSFPASCKDLFIGGKCDADAFGSYHLESVKKDGLVYSTAVFTGPEGVQVVEESWEKDGKVVKAVIENKVLHKKASIEVADGKVTYKLSEKEGKEKVSHDDAEENLVVPSTVMSYVRPRFPDLMAGKTVRLKIAVLDRMDSFTFEMKKIRQEKGIDGETIMVLEMKPTSFIIKAFVDKMIFYVHPRTGEMFAFEGKSSLRRKEGEKYKDLIVNSEYQYKVNAFNRPACDPLQALEKNTIPKCEVKAQ